MNSHGGANFLDWSLLEFSTILIISLISLTVWPDIFLISHASTFVSRIFDLTSTLTWPGVQWCYSLSHLEVSCLLFNKYCILYLFYLIRMMFTFLCFSIPFSILWRKVRIKNSWFCLCDIHEFLWVHVSRITGSCIDFLTSIMFAITFFNSLRVDFDFRFIFIFPSYVVYYTYLPPCLLMNLQLFYSNTSTSQNSVNIIR